MKKTFWVLSFIGAGLAAGVLIAEGSTGAARRSLGYFGIGWHQVQTEEFQTRLDRTPVDYPRHGKDFWAVGGGGLFFSRRLVLGGEGYGLIGPRRSGGGYDSLLDGGYGMFQIGYDLLDSPDWTLYPLLGIGGGVFRWKIQRTDFPGDFDRLIGFPEVGTTLENAFFMLQASLGVDRWVRIGGRRDERSGFFLIFGIRGGYSHTPSANRWEVRVHNDSYYLSNGPDLGLGGPFIRLTFGIGG